MNYYNSPYFELKIHVKGGLVDVTKTEFVQSNMVGRSQLLITTKSFFRVDLHYRFQEIHRLEPSILSRNTPTYPYNSQVSTYRNLHYVENPVSFVTFTR